VTFRICLLTAFTPSYRDEFVIARPHFEHYARRHNYDFRAIENEVAPRHGAWIKIAAIRETLNEPFDFILWVDTDALIVRKDIDVRSAIRPNIDLHLVWHDLIPAIHGDPAHYNAGVMLIRVSDWSRAFFDRVWEDPLDHKWFDQSVILHLLGYDDLLGIGPDRPNQEARAHVARLDIAWNSIPGVAVSDDPIVHHYAGLPKSVRVPLLKSDAMMIDHRAKLTAGERREFMSHICSQRISRLKDIYKPRLLRKITRPLRDVAGYMRRLVQISKIF
jgi:galactosyl transferase GMA12/MNN10 family